MEIDEELFQKPKNRTPYDPAIPLLHTDIRNLCQYARNTCKVVLIAALLTGAKI